VVRGTSGDLECDSPLRSPGVDVRDGDVISAINGMAVTKEQVPNRLLLNQAKNEVELTVVRDGNTRTVRVRTLKSETRALYREWVEKNRQEVHARTGNRVGYLHIPDMGAHGFAEFHRLWMVESACDALIVDVRYNGGGHVSQLLLEKVARKPLGYDLQRWGKPETYPSYAVPGPVIALTNQWAGSDGDIFSHSFKLMKIGTLIGKRTWGGVIGISPRNPLADGAVTTQPEYSFWFKDVGWGVENYGTDPDVDIDIAPQDYANGRDPQLDYAIEMAIKELDAVPATRPSFGDRPRLTLPSA
jgi:tricorn protease